MDLSNMLKKNVGYDKEELYIPKMINIDTLMSMEEEEREAILSFISGDGPMGIEVRNMLETKGIITNISKQIQ